MILIHSSLTVREIGPVREPQYGAGAAERGEVTEGHPIVTSMFTRWQARQRRGPLQLLSTQAHAWHSRCTIMLSTHARSHQQLHEQDPDSILQGFTSSHSFISRTIMLPVQEQGATSRCTSSSSRQTRHDAMAHSSSPGRLLGEAGELSPSCSIRTALRSAALQRSASAVALGMNTEITVDSSELQSLGLIKKDTRPCLPHSTASRTNRSAGMVHEPTIHRNLL